MRGGANGASDWSRSAAGGQPAGRAGQRPGDPWERVQGEFNDSWGGKKVRSPTSSSSAVARRWSRRRGTASDDITVPFTPRADRRLAGADRRRVVLGPPAEGRRGFRSYLRAGESAAETLLLLDRANALHLTAPEMTVLVGGMRALGANVGGTFHGVH